MAKLLLLNLFLMLLWPALNQEFTPQAFVFGFLGGLVLLTLVERSYGRRILHAVGFVLYLLWEILASNINLAVLSLRPGDPTSYLDSCIVGIPLTVSSDLEITLLASVITLTPGTLSMDLGKNEKGERVLYVHNLQVGKGKEGEFRDGIKNGFERRILQITRGKA